MASYHLSVKSISRSSGRSAVAAAAYRSGERLFDARQGMEHDYTRKGGVEYTELIAPEDAPEWAENRDRLWNEAEASERRKNSVVAREWELSLPSELSTDARRTLTVDFARTLVERYGVVADVAVHAPNRDGDSRNHHAHILTTTRQVGPDGFGSKTRVLDVKQTASVEVFAMREHWAERQNEALERINAETRVDHRTLDAQRLDAEAERDRLDREIAEHRATVLRERVRVLGTLGHAPKDLERQNLDRDERPIAGEKLDPATADKYPGAGETRFGLERRLIQKTLEAAALDRAPEIKLGPAINAIERKAARAAEAHGRPYTPITDTGLKVHEAREGRSRFQQAIDRLGALSGRVTLAARDVSKWMRTGRWPRERESYDKESISERKWPVERSDDDERRTGLESRLRRLASRSPAPEKSRDLDHRNSDFRWRDRDDDCGRDR